MWNQWSFDDHAITERSIDKQDKIRPIRETVKTLSWIIRSHDPIPAQLHGSLSFLFLNSLSLFLEVLLVKIHYKESVSFSFPRSSALLKIINYVSIVSDKAYTTFLVLIYHFWPPAPSYKFWLEYTYMHVLHFCTQISYTFKQSITILRWYKICTWCTASNYSSLL